MIEWAAGLFEGEGSAGRYGGKGKMSLTTTDEDVIRRFHSAIGCGTVCGPLRNGPLAIKPAWRWQAQSKDDVLYAGAHLLPFMGERRAAQIEAAISYDS